MPIDSLQEKIDQENRLCKAKMQIIDKKCASLRTDLTVDLSNVRPSISQCSADFGFTPLKALSGVEYEKIIGYYVIHNIENGRCYVGQSKDVLKRIK